MATLAAPVASAEDALAVVDPKAYAAWDPLLDVFDQLRTETPVVRITAPADEFAP